MSTNERNGISKQILLRNVEIGLLGKRVRVRKARFVTAASLQDRPGKFRLNLNFGHHDSCKSSANGNGIARGEQLKRLLTTGLESPAGPGSDAPFTTLLGDSTPSGRRGTPSTSEP